MRAALLAPILPQVMKEGESKQVALILMKNSHFDRTLRYSKYQHCASQPQVKLLMFFPVLASKIAVVLSLSLELLIFLQSQPRIVDYSN